MTLVKENLLVCNRLYKWLFWPEKFSGLSRNGPQALKIHTLNGTR